MNWFGLFTMAMLVVLAVWIFAYEFGYEQAEKDYTCPENGLCEITQLTTRKGASCLQYTKRVQYQLVFPVCM